MTCYSHWQYFLAIEADFATTARYVEICEDNYSTYSVEYTKLLLAAASEVDVLCKMVCERLDSAAKRGNINEYRACIAARTKLAGEKVLIRRYGIQLEPWSAWQGDANPQWWTSYNRVKHKRNLHFPEGNLKNCMDSVAALFVLTIYAHKAERSSTLLEPCPQLLGREREPGRLLVESGYAVPAFDYSESCRT